MKILIGTSRSGTTFYYHWFLNQYAYDMLPIHSKRDETFNAGHGQIRYGESFNPGHSWRLELGMDRLTPEVIKSETHRRLGLLKPNSIVGVVIDEQVDYLFWEYVKDKPVTLIERQDQFAQILSWGRAMQTNNWVDWADWGKQKVENLNFLYTRQWFDDITSQLEAYNSRKNNWFTYIEEILYYEDIKNYNSNGQLPIKQQTANVTNISELKFWYEEWKNKSDIYHEVG
tara:strand:- start:3882 stop:4568 length:687 start_codon:yes stop_codon:yes gene_type:complete